MAHRLSWFCHGVTQRIGGAGALSHFSDLDRFETGRQTVLKAIDLGITHFDLANNYGPPPGAAEKNMGTGLQYVQPLDRSGID